MAPPIRVQLADVRTERARLHFTATLEGHGRHIWSGQDWILVPIDASPWGIPAVRHDAAPVIAQWFAGQAAAGAETTSHTYVLDSQASSLSVRAADGTFSTVQASQRTPAPGAWLLALRLTRPGDHGIQEAVVIVPVLRVEVSDTGTESYQVYEIVNGWRPV